MRYNDPTSQNIEATRVEEAMNEYGRHDARGLVIDGQVRASGQYFQAPLITPVQDKVWQGGCFNRVDLPDEIDHVVSLYPWEKYALAEHQTRTEYKMYDGPIEQNEGITEAADEITEIIQAGEKTILVHCQAGLNRSALTLGLALVNLGAEPQETVELLRSKRSAQVLSNKSFEDYLLSKGGILPPGTRVRKGS